MKAARPVIAGGAAEVEIVVDVVQNKAAILIMDAAAARRIGEGGLLERLECRAGAVVETDRKAQPFLRDAGERASVNGRGGVKDEVKADRTAMSIRSFPDAGEIFGMGNGRTEIEAAVLLRGRRGLRPSVANQQQRDSHEPKYRCAFHAN